MSANSDIRVVELFAGVGGFRVGLERCSERFKTIWANQWEPGQAGQWAYKCYSKNFGEDSHCVNADIATVIDQVPPHDLLVGGFPCQDYSVASTGAKGIEGKKGVLWWSIYQIIQKNHPNYVLLENVDRLLKSPASQRGRDFGIILKCLQEEGYGVEWRVINAADYGWVQRRRRTFIFAFKNTTPQYKHLTSYFADGENKDRTWLTNKGFFAKAFPVYSESADPKKITKVDFTEYTDTVDVTKRFKAAFYNSGVLYNGSILSLEAVPQSKEPMTLREIVVDGDVDKSYFIEDEDLEKWKYMKGSKTIERTSKTGFSYTFSEGPIAFPDPLDRPGRTMLTSEGTKNRSSHAITDPKTGKLRILLPEECERMNGFPTGWTDTEMPKRQRTSSWVTPLSFRSSPRWASNYWTSYNEKPRLHSRPWFLCFFRHDQEVPYHGADPCC